MPERADVPRRWAIAHRGDFICTLRTALHVSEL
jgi:hypothetical protein